ncbi:MAG: T9SS type A sorting domain-containing protein [Duncaniella sp.]|nr:T9SS type A sorting domain-containing protein [Duncaniella sp.]
MTAFYTPAKEAETQGLNWKFVSQSAINSSIQVISRVIKIPQTGYYLIRLRTNENLRASVADFNMNGTLYYSDIPINSYCIDHIIPADSMVYSVMTLSQKSGIDDPMIFVHGGAADRVVGYNDDAKSAYRTKYGLTIWDSCISQKYFIKTNAISVNSYSSSTPVSSCTVIVNKESDNYQSAPSIYNKQVSTGIQSYTPAINISGNYCVDGFIIIDALDEIKQISTFDINGKCICILKPTSSYYFSSFKDLNIYDKGIYTIRVTTNDDTVIKKIFIK